jgi:hypothetical protein
MYFVGAVHGSSSVNTDYFTGANLPRTGSLTNNDNNFPVIKTAIVADSGVILKIKDDRGAHASPAYGSTGSYGTYGNSTNSFVMYLDGFTSSDEVLYPSSITASFDHTKPNYVDYVLNTDMTQIDSYGYAVYSNFGMADVGSNAILQVSGTNYIDNTASYENIVFCLSGSEPSTTVPDFNNYEERYTAPISPYVTSQDIGGTKYKLFRVEALSDGVWANENLKISIRDVRKSTSDNTDFGSFTLLIRAFDDTDSEPVILEQFKTLDLNPGSENYIARRIGDKTVYFDHDYDDEDKQKMVVDGEYPNVSKHIRIVATDELKNSEVPENAIPFGFTGNFMLNTFDMFDVAGIPEIDADITNASITDVAEFFNQAVVPPVPLRTEISKKSGNNKSNNNKLYWGVKFERTLAGATNSNAGLGQPNYSDKAEPAIKAFTKFYGNVHVAESATAYESPVWLQSDIPTSGSSVLWNNEFNLGNISVVTKSLTDTDADRSQIYAWKYHRNGVMPAGSRSFSVDSDLNTNSDVAKFSFFLQYGWDGTDITRIDERRMNQTALNNASNGSGWDTNIANSYKVAIKAITGPENTDISLLAVPDIRDSLITDYVIERCEERFDCFYIMDAENVGDSSTKINSLTSSTRPLVSETVQTLEDRGLNTNFAATYWPDVKIFDDITNKSITVPPSVVVMGAFAFNDKVSFPWFAPAGFNRGALESVTDVVVRLSKENRNDLYDADINPIYVHPSDGAVVFGQKTLQAAQSALDRVNVRRLMIEVRRAVKVVSQGLLFEPNTQSTWQKFTNQVNPILERIKEQAGIERYKVIMNDTTNSSTDVENYVMRGTIYLQPTKVVEFISLDFVITNAGVIFS